MQKTTLIFDIGKTNKKLLLFGKNMELLYQEEIVFNEITDEDGFPCDDIEQIAHWINQKVETLINSDKYEIEKINFATYGASLVYLDKNGKRLTPVYNYLKPLSEGIDTKLHEKYGGEQEFSRKTASPALKMLNSGLQILNLKQAKPDIFTQVRSILHFPQYFSYLLSGKITSEATSIGCHTAMWDFDQMQYHQWLADEGINLPKPIALSETTNMQIEAKRIAVGIGIHDSSASLVPYLKASDKNFVLVSTGTWCINMNPFNNTALTANELKKDCLNYMSYEQKPIKSSRVFLGHIHDINLKPITEHFGKAAGAYKTIRLNEKLLNRLFADKQNKKIFFKSGVPENHIDISVNYSIFTDFEHAYHQLVLDLALLVSESIDLIISGKDKIEQLYITGGFARNQIFTKALAKIYHDKSVFVSKIDNATALGAALVINDGFKEKIDLGLTEI